VLAIEHFLKVEILLSSDMMLSIHFTLVHRSKSLKVC
jgi:hypothetical protein